MRRTFAFILAMVLLISVFPSALTSGEIKDKIAALEEEETALQQEMEELESKLSDNLTELKSIVEQKDILDRQLLLLHDREVNLEQQIAEKNLLLSEKQEELELARERHEQLAEKHKSRIRAMEENGSLSYWSILFSARSFGELLDRLYMIEEIANSDKRRLEELQQAAEAVAEAEAVLLSQKQELEASAGELLQTRKDFEEKKQEADALLQTLIAKGEEYEFLLEQSEEAQEALMEELAKLESDYEEALKQEQQPQLPSAPPSDSEWITPVPYYVLTSPFGMRLHPELHIWRMHNGVDMACAAYTPIYASRSGVVTVAAYQEYGAGNYVQISHGDGFRSIYMHMIYYVVSPGQQVAQGEIIGYVGSTGLSSGNHLHFGISYNGTYVNPMEYLP